MSTEEPTTPRRVRRRVDSLKIDKTAIAERVIEFYNRSMRERQDEMEARLQRYAKYRMWTEGKDWPWENCADVGLPDLMQHSLRVQDTLHNAVMSIRPAVVSKAVNQAHMDKQEAVDNLLDYQFFEESPGETVAGTLIEQYVNDGVFTCYTPWVKEEREVTDVRTMPPIPNEQDPAGYFREELQALYPDAMLTTRDGWDWTIIDHDDKDYFVQFFTLEDGGVEMDIRHDALVFNGPRPIPKMIQDVLHPARCENLQIPGPSNPLGASFVILRDYPTLDEIKRLAKGPRAFYDLVTKEELEKLGVVSADRQHQELEEQKDRFQGATVLPTDPPKGAESHKRLTRLMCFDTYDIDGDGTDEDVIWWIILETKTVLKAKLLTQMFPSVPPRRPFAEAQFIPVPGRRLAIGLLEMLECLHDIKKQTMDQTIDSGTMSNVPFFFYKSTSSMRPEVIRLWPGEGYPLSDPKNDVNFPQMPTQGQAFGFNLYTLLNQEEERLSMNGELQFGRVPQGKASALRTVSGMQTVLAQGDARPERILRRFFIGLTEVFANFHELNRRFLPKRKQIRIAGYLDPRKDPYQTIGGPEAIDGVYQFKFMANALNTNKTAVQQALMQLMGTFVSQLNVQLGLIDPDGIFRLQYDFGKSMGIDPLRYLKAPSPGALLPNILAEEAINQILNGVQPEGVPAEGAELHLKKLMEFVQSDQFGLLLPEQVPIFKAWLQQVQGILQRDRMQAAIAASIQQFGQGQAQQAGPGATMMPGPGAAEIQANPQIQNNELLDESLPGAGGGGNAEKVAA